MNEYSSIFATGLPLEKISKIIATSKNDTEYEEKIAVEGEKYLKRYVAFKQYQTLVKLGEQKLPLNIIISGIPGIGKTALAQALSKTFDIRIIIGGDALRSSFRTLLKKEDNEVFFDSVYNSWKYFGDFSRQNLNAGYFEQSKIMNKAVEYMITDRGFRDGESLIVEYLHFLPSQFNQEFLKHPSFLPIVLQITDEEIYSHRIMQRDQYSHLKSTGKRLLEQKEKYLLIQEFQCSEMEKYNLPIFNINDFDSGFDAIIEFVSTRIIKLNQIKNYTEKNILLEKIKQDRIK
ncbi:MAG: hypothetical protein ACFFDW_05800 [Candidatus Thorarchaeota archaeon]